MARRRRKARIHMPASISGIAIGRKSYGKGTEVLARPPAANTDKLVESSKQARAVCCCPKGRIGIAAEPNYRPCPRCTVERVASCITPQNAAGLFRYCPRESLIDAHEAVLDECLNIVIAEIRSGGSARIKHTAIVSECATYGSIVNAILSSLSGNYELS